MKKILSLLTLVALMFNGMTQAQPKHSHEGHVHQELVDGKKLEVDPDRFDKFLMDLSDCQIAVISVKGMVCDFCARGIEKTFRKDVEVEKIGVDLNRGKVLVAYSKNKKIDLEEIKRAIRVNGQNVTNLQIVTLD